MARCLILLGPSLPQTIWMFPRIGGKPPKWMVYFMENPIKLDDLVVFPYFWFNTHISEFNVWSDSETVFVEFLCKFDDFVMDFCSYSSSHNHLGGGFKHFLFLALPGK